ncbi:extensin-like [Quercus lobata]|uniref:extensin-like n=1 Tax=Quercus lobata TaxID=97700 RepID=UPI00124706A1|nr:extensin-like [Quercus lobata]
MAPTITYTSNNNTNTNNPTPSSPTTSINTSAPPFENRAPYDTPSSLLTPNMAPPIIYTSKNNTNTHKPTPPSSTTSINTFAPPPENRAPKNTPLMATWKRIPRPGTHETQIKTEPVGQKRAAPHQAHQSELSSKKYLVSQIDNESIVILAEAGSQPCQKQ